MSVQQAKKSAAGNPRTLEEARAFGDLPEFRGRAELEKFFRARAARQEGYRLRKELKALMGDIIANTWEGEWTDSQTGTRMAGHGVEVWTMRGGRIAVWDAAFNFKPVGKASAMGIV